MRFTSLQCHLNLLYSIVVHSLVQLGLFLEPIKTLEDFSSRTPAYVLIRHRTSQQILHLVNPISALSSVLYVPHFSNKWCVLYTSCGSTNCDGVFIFHDIENDFI